MDHAALRNFRDFLQLYNGMSEMCFSRCIYTLNDRNLTEEEASCVNLCARKHINVNHKIMQVYVEIQPGIVQKRMDDMNKAQEIANLAAAREASAASETSAVSETSSEVTPPKD